MIMTNDEINEYIYVQILKHKSQIRKCTVCSQAFTAERIVCPTDQSKLVDASAPDYCSDDSPRRLVHEAEAKVIELLSAKHKNPRVMYCRYVMAANGFRYDDLGYLYEQVIRATAEQRSRACVEAHKESTI